jgi:hypothetical protein
MTPKERAEELVDKMSFETHKYNAISCAIKAVEEIEIVLLQERVFESLDYWKEVKKEIEKL